MGRGASVSLAKVRATVTKSANRDGAINHTYEKLDLVMKGSVPSLIIC